MSKQGKRKITVELPKAKDLSNRPSVFERLGTKKAAAAKKASESCRQWAQHGTCPYGKTCKFASTHTLISPSKQRAAIKDSSDIKRTLIKDDAKSRLHSTVVVRSGRTPEPEWDNWDQNDLEYADADVLEKRRQQLQRELEIQLKMDTGNRKEKKKTVPSSSSSSRSSSTTSVSSSTSGGSSSSSSSPRDSRKKVRKAKSKRNSSSSSGSEHVSKKKRSKTESLKRDKSASCKRSSLKKDVGRVAKKHEVAATKKKVTAKTALSKKSLSPAKKAGGTPPINNKNIPKGYILNKHNTHSKSPTKKDKNRSPSPHSTKEREKDKEREREKERDRLKEKEREREKERDKEREREREKERRRSKSPRSKGRSRSPVRRHGSHPPRDPRRKDSPTRSRGSSPKGRAARDNNSDKHRSKTSPARDDRKDDKRKDKDLKDRSLERRKDKHDEKDRHDRLRKDRDHQRDDTRLHREKEREEALARCQERQRERERLKDQTKREQEAKRNRERDRRINENKGLEKPTPDKPVERLLPRPEERLAALAATNRNIGLERAISTNRERSEARTERSSRKGDRSVDRDRIDRLPKRQSDRRSSMDRVDRNEYSRNMDRSYDHSHSMDRSYDRPNERYDDLVPLDRERERSPGAFPVQSRERDLHYDSPYDIQGSHSRGYVDPDERGYDDHLDDHHAVDRGFIDDGRTRDCGRRDDHSWEGRETSVDQERQYIHHSHAQHGHPHKEWENEDYHGDWNRQDRHWQHRDPQHQVMDWSDKERDVDSTWHSHRQPTGSTNASRNRLHDDGNYRGRMDHGRMETNQHLHSMTNKRNLGNRDAPPDISDAKKAPSMNPQTSGPTHAHSAQTAHPSAETEDPIPDDLSEISDDPDEILNRDDMMEHDVEKPAPKQTSVDTSSQKSEISTGCQENSNAAPPVENKVDQTQEPDPEDTLDNLGFEEISDGELEEDQRVKGLGDALGVDWASLVAEVQGKKEKGLAENGDKKEQSGARQYWQPQKVLARIGVSLYMAGENMIKEIFSDKTTVVKMEDGLKSTDVNVKQEEFKLSHPVASIQVAIERRKQQRLSLFGTGTGFTRALCARQDLALRRHLCNLPINESAHEIHPPDPQLFAMAQKLIQKTS